MDCCDTGLILSESKRFQLNYVNPLLYPLSVRNYPSPERGIFCIKLTTSMFRGALNFDCKIS